MKYAVGRSCTSAPDGTGSRFYKTNAGRTKLRFCFCKKDETLQDADRRLARLVPAGVTLH